MTITNSSTRLVAIATGVAVALALMGAAAIAPAQAAGLTQTQIQSILSLLQSFGADQATINNVQAALNGQPTSGTGSSSTGSTGGTCPALTRDLMQGSSGADVMALQVFLNGNASTQVAASGAGSPGMETKYFGPATKAAVIKFQMAHSITPTIGYVGPKTRAVIASVCGTGTTGTSGTGTTGTTGAAGTVTVSAAAQPVNSLAPQGASRVPFTTFTITNNSSAAVTINSVTVQRSGLAQDAAFSGVTLLDSNGLQIGTAQTFNSNHQANVGNSGFSIPAGTSQTFTVAGNMAADESSYTGEVASLQVVAINTSATVSGSLPISGASQTINSSLTIGSVSTSTSSYDPGGNQTKNIGDTGVRFSGIKFTAGSTEDLKLYSIRWRQTGSASASDLSNVVTVVNGTSYPTTVDINRYYTTIFPGGLLIPKGNSIDVYVQGDITGTDAASRTVQMNIDKVTDVYFVGQLYGYGIAPSGTNTPWYSGYTTTINAGTLTLVSKADTGMGAAQNVATNVNNQPMGGFTTNFAGEPVSVSGMNFYIATSTTGTGLFTSVSVVDENGTVVAGPVDATWHSGTDAGVTNGEVLSYTDTVTFPTGSHSYYLEGKVASGITGGSFTVSTNPSTWTNPTGQTSGNTISLSGASTVQMNSMTVKSGALSVSMSATPASQTIVGGGQTTLANVLLDASQSGEDVRINAIPLYFAGNAANLSGCQLFNGSTALNTGSNVKTSVTGSGTTENNFVLDNSLVIPKGTVTTVSVQCNISSSATSSSYYQVLADSTTNDWSVTGQTSGNSITPTINTTGGGTFTLGTASMSVTVDSSSPASTTVSGGSTGQTVAVYNVRPTNDNVNLTKLGLTLDGSANASDVTNVSLYNGSTLLGTATFGAGQKVATSTFSTPLAMTANTSYQITVKADFATVGTGKPGTEGDIVAIDPNSAEGNGTTGLVDSGASGSTSGVRLYNSYPTITMSGTGAVLSNGAQTLANVTVSADAAGQIGLYKLTFAISTSTITGVTNPTFQGPNGNVASSSLTFDFSGATTQLNVFFDSTSNTSDAIVGAGSSKTYTLGGTVTGLGTNGGVVSVALRGDSTANNTMTKATSVSGKNVWSPMATTTSLDDNTNDWTNSYALTKGCFASVGIGSDCNYVSLSK